MDLRSTLISGIVFLGMSSSFAEEYKHAPLPDKLVKAHTVFLEDSTGDHKLADSVYEQVGAWGRWTFVTDRSKADVLIVLSFREDSNVVVTSGSATAVGHSAYGTGVGVPIQYYVYLHVADRETGDPLWTAKSRMKVGAGRTAGGLLSDLKQRLPAAGIKRN